MAKSFLCKLVTPTASLVSDQMVYVSIPLWDGLAGIMPGRAPLMARLGLGELRLDFADSSKGEGGSRSYLIDGGFAKMSRDELTILAESATPVEEITLEEAQAELTKADQAQPSGEGAAREASVENIRRAKARARHKVSLARSHRAI